MNICFSTVCVYAFIKSLNGCLCIDLQDKCIKKNVVRNIVEAAAIRDLNEASVYDSE